MGLKHLTVGVCALFAALTCAPAQAIVVNGAQGRLTSTPAARSDAYLNGGWNLEGNWNGFNATPIAPHFFITAGHIGGSVGQYMTYHEQIFATTAVFDDPNSDLRIWQTSGTFRQYAQLYTSSDETSREMLVYGMGGARGQVVSVNGVNKGWQWGARDGQRSWGSNIVDGIANGGAGLGTVLAWKFDQNARSCNAWLS